jgi:hypothetical protein
LALALGGRPALQLLISDVPGDDPAVIGPGPLVAGATDLAPTLASGVPGWLRLGQTPPAGGGSLFRRRAHRDYRPPGRRHGRARLQRGAGPVGEPRTGGRRDLSVHRR